MSAVPSSLTITRPDDWHLHLRDGDALAAVAPATAQQFARAIVMPNLRPPVTTAEQALAYRQRILQALPSGAAFEPLMTLYLTDQTTPQEILKAKEAGVVAVKLYPAGATTHSDAGVTDLRKTGYALDAMQRLGLPLLVHGEVTDPTVDLFDREAVFIDRVMLRLRRDFPELKVVFEHITTREAAQYVGGSGAEHTAATLTPQHLLYNRNAIFTGGLRPHYYCLPVLKREVHRPGAGGGGHQWQPEVLPRHRQRAACRGPEGARLGVCRLLHGALRAGAVRRGLRGGRCAGQAGSLRQPPRARLLRLATQHRHRDAQARALDSAGEPALRRGPHQALVWRRNPELEAAMSAIHESRIALLIDADNAPAAKIEVILAELAKIGVANIRRAYGNWKKNELKGWEQVLHEYAIRPIQQFDYSKGKNATDMVMAIEAMDLLYTDRPEAFGIVSSDADFTPLVMHLRAKGATVYGFGAKKTPAPFVNACSRFLFLETLGGPVDEPPVTAPAPAARKAAGRAGKSAGKSTDAVPEKAPEPAPVAGGSVLKLDTAALKQDAKLVSLLRTSVDAVADDDGWSTLGAVGKQIANQASFDPRNYGYKKLSDLIEATQLFDIERRASHVAVRDKRVGRAARN